MQSTDYRKFKKEKKNLCIYFFCFSNLCASAALAQRRIHTCKYGQLLCSRSVTPVTSFCFLFHSFVIFLFLFLMLINVYKNNILAMNWFNVILCFLNKKERKNTNVDLILFFIKLFGFCIFNFLLYILFSFYYC